MLSRIEVFPKIVPFKRPVYQNHCQKGKIRTYKIQTEGPRKAEAIFAIYRACCRQTSGANHIWRFWRHPYSGPVVLALNYGSDQRSPCGFTREKVEDYGLYFERNAILSYLPAGHFSANLVWGRYSKYWLFQIPRSIFLHAGNRQSKWTEWCACLTDKNSVGKVEYYNWKITTIEIGHQYLDQINKHKWKPAVNSRDKWHLQNTAVIQNRQKVWPPAESTCFGAGKPPLPGFHQIGDKKAK